MDRTYTLAEVKAALDAVGDYQPAETNPDYNGPDTYYDNYVGCHNCGDRSVVNPDAVLAVLRGESLDDWYTKESR